MDGATIGAVWLLAFIPRTKRIGTKARRADLEPARIADQPDASRVVGSESQGEPLIDAVEVTIRVTDIDDLYLGIDETLVGAAQVESHMPHRIATGEQDHE